MLWGAWDPEPHGEVPLARLRIAHQHARRWGSHAASVSSPTVWTSSGTQQRPSDQSRGTGTRPFSSGGRHQPHRRHLCLRTFSPLQGPWATHAGCNLLQVPASEMNRTSCSSPHTVADPAGFAMFPVAAPQTRILQLPCPRFTARFTKPSTHTFYHELSSRAKGIFNKRYLKTSFE